MTDARRSTTITAYDIVGAKVYDADGKKVGRVDDLVAERRGDSLRVTSLIVGRGGLLDRFGWAKGGHGSTVAWEDVASLQPTIKLRTRGIKGRR